MTTSHRWDANRLLAALSPDEAARLRPRLEPVTLARRQIIAEVGEPVRHVSFPLTAVLALLVVMPDERVVEVATIGNEGVVGVQAVLGPVRTTRRVVCQVSGLVLRLPVDAFRAAFQSGGSLSSIVERYVFGLVFQISQSVACAQLHSVQQRCARWLLATGDRLGADQFPLTHALLAEMLAVRRASVSDAVGTLQQAGVITSQYGQMTILDRAGLERYACVCYQAIQQQFAQLLTLPG